MKLETRQDRIYMRVYKIERYSSRDADTLVGYYNVLQVPEVGEIVSCDGEPYLVAERGWAFGDDGVTYCYVRVRG